MMSHKAFLFNYGTFQDELRPILETSLATDDTTRLVEFVDHHLLSLKDPNEGDPIQPKWSDLVKMDAHQIGDLALTRYYDPRQDIGLGAAWMSLSEVADLAPDGSSPLLGRPIGPPTNLFDPGKMGSYVQSESDVGDSLRLLEQSRHQRELHEMIEILRRAAEHHKGLYVTF